MHTFTKYCQISLQNGPTSLHAHQHVKRFLSPHLHKQCYQIFKFCRRNLDREFKESAQLISEGVGVRIQAFSLYICFAALEESNSVVQTRAFQTLVCMGILWGSCLKIFPGSVGLRWDLRVCISSYKKQVLLLFVQRRIEDLELEKWRPAPENKSLGAQSVGLFAIPFPHV